MQTFSNFCCFLGCLVFLFVVTSAFFSYYSLECRTGYMCAVLIRFSFNKIEPYQSYSFPKAL